MEVVLVFLGAVVGALATGGVAAYDAWRQRQLRRRVAARVILGDLVILRALVNVILKRQRWPERLDFQTPVDTWREYREAFAAGASAFEWALADGVFGNLHRTAPMARLGEPLTPADERVLKDLEAAVGRVVPIVEAHSASKRELKRLLAQLQEAVAYSSTEREREWVAEQAKARSAEGSKQPRDP